MVFLTSLDSPKAVKTVSVKIKLLKGILRENQKAVDNVVTVENRVLDAISTALGNVVMPQVEKAVRSITESTGRGPNGMVQNPHQRVFAESTVKTPLLSVTSRMD